MEHPILFSSEMVRAILDRRKTQTRRVIRPQPVRNGYYYDYKSAYWLNTSDATPFASPLCPYQPSDLLWVREACSIGYNDELDLVCDYHADGKRGCFDITKENEKSSLRYINESQRPAFLMPRWASRITLKVNSIRVDRVQDITWQDIAAEGCPSEYHMDNCNGMGHAMFGWYEHLWDSINGKRGYSWDVNPWVWVIDFETVRQ